MNPLLQKLQSKAAVPWGTWLMSMSPLAAEAMGRAGFDWVLIDLEHVPVDQALALSLLQAVAATPAEAVVRLAWNDPVRIKQALDLGALTLMIPFVNTQQEAEAAVAAIKYPPWGMRGYAAMTRASGFGTIANYAEWANANTACIVQLESAAAIAELTAIASVRGVDALFVGPGDLAASLGYAGEIDAAPVQALIAQAARAANAVGKAIGIVGATPEMAVAYRDMGYDYVAVASDLGMMMRQARQVVGVLHASPVVAATGDNVY